MEKKYKLKDVTEPNLLDEIFDYDSVPRAIYLKEPVPLEIPEEFWITDTTFRDGQQARPPYTVEQIVDLYKFLNRLSGPRGVIRQTEFFLYTDKDKKAVEKCLDLGFKFPEITAWIRAKKEDFALVKEFNLKETGILTSISDYHIFLKLKKTRKEAIDEYLDIVRRAIEQGIKPRCHVEDVTRADIYGVVIPFAQELMKISEETKVPVKLRLCDTMGYGLDSPYADLPRGVPRLIQTLRKEVGIKPEQLEWHGHNDFHRVLTNGVAAWLHGCSSINGAIFGSGERTGNTPIEALVIEWIAMTGDMAEIDTTVITEMAQYYQNVIGTKIPDNYPFVGKNFNVTSAGIHADGVLKNERIYNIFNTAKLLNRPVRVNITDKSGLAGVAYWINAYFGLSGNNMLKKNDPRVLSILDWVNEQYKSGRTTSISDLEMEELIKKYFPKGV
ncbi:MAG TPA: 2-isopropylmalate synthase [Spirochaetota bacterium]|nr:2-isopropylmalate synthase [Spirochaetota bacterium]HOM38121.1 2-isopropylmalate synthase [Spirochaetota bacterium]HPQ48923.1 2-isopropylmalate synthase [Spirochaetota bacterium]